MAIRTRALRYIPNLISLARIVAMPLLMLLALTRREDAFKWLLLAALVSDIIDGLVARLFSWTSELGSRLDSLADALLWIPAVTGIYIFHPELMRDYAPVVVVVVGFWVLEIVVALARYGSLSSFHTYLSRASAYALGVFVISMFLWGIQPWLLYAAAVVTVLSVVEELLLIKLLPEPASNVRGLYWALQRMKVAAGE